MLGGDEMLMPTKRRARKSQVLAGEIRKRIVQGVYPVNSYLPAERKLVREIGGSLRTISAALSCLAGEGLVVQARGRGTRVLGGEAESKQKRILLVAPWDNKYTENDSTLRMSPEASSAMQGAERWLKSLGYRCEASRYDKLPADAAEIACTWGGVLFFESFWRQDVLLFLEQQRMPMVVCNIEHDLPVSGTFVDHRKSTATAVEILVSLGHRRVAYIGARPETYFYKHALRGYREGLAKVDLPSDEGLIQLWEAGREIYGYRAGQKLLQMSQRPTGIVAARDSLASGACAAIEEAGLRIGYDISVIGFDNISWPLPQSFLTTFQEPCLEMGVTAAEMLVDRMVNGWRPPERRELPAPILLRRSAGPPAEGACTDGATTRARVLLQPLTADTGKRDQPTAPEALEQRTLSPGVPETSEAPRA
jgi:DNA-binding LacI/PurR family transcriptional regulator